MTLHDEILSRYIWAIESMTTCSTISTLAQLSIKDRGQELWDEKFAQFREDKQFLESVEAATFEDYKTLIPTWALINLITIYEVWMSDVLRAILRKYPQKIQREDIKTSIITESSTYEECLEKLIDAELGGLFYKSPKEITKRLQEITSIDIENIPELADIFELKAARDILLHNKGVVNKIYLRKARDKARAREGKKIKIDSSALMDCYKIVTGFIMTVSEKLDEKFKKVGDKK